MTRNGPAGTGEAPAYADRLRLLIERTVPVLNDMSEETARRRPAPGKWSPKEVIGHLVDSACNNHARFVRCQIESESALETYEQDDWVSTQAYRDASWSDVCALWRAYNTHLVHVMTVTPAGERMRERGWPNLAEIGFATAPACPRTLDRLMEDYVDHLVHHLRQISGVDA